MDTTTNGGGKGGIITWRSLIFGLLGIFIMSGLSGYHDNVLGGTIMIGNHMPGGAFAYFMAIGLGWNGLWVLLDRGFGLGVLAAAGGFATRWRFRCANCSS